MNRDMHVWGGSGAAFGVWYGVPPADWGIGGGSDTPVGVFMARKSAEWPDDQRVVREDVRFVRWSRSAELAKGAAELIASLDPETARQIWDRASMVPRAGITS